MYEFTILIMLILIGKILVSFYYLKVSKDYLKKIESSENKDNNFNKKLRLLILIPVLREQNVIEKTLEHFKKLKIENIELIICISGTVREELEKSKFNTNIPSTKEVVQEWIKKYNLSKKENLDFYYSEANDLNGDRASQLNYGVRMVEKNIIPDIVGVYDADSLPNEKTLYEVVEYYEEDEEIVCQQPVHFVAAANRMAKEKRNPLLIANALYQTTWTFIRELPRWATHLQAGKKKPHNIFKRNDYLIGHGEFLSYKLYKKFLFPENEVTDGIQLGYRVSMSGKTIAPLKTFCEDDVPQKITQLIGQHKRWFGGCMRLKEAYDWSEKNYNKKAILQLLDGYWSQMSWAYASLLITLGLFFSQGWVFKYILIFTLIYCYLIPIIAHRLISVKIEARLIDWLCLPIAIFLKGIGPNLYFFNKLYSKLTNKKIKYSKVER